MANFDAITKRIREWLPWHRETSPDSRTPATQTVAQTSAAQTAAQTSVTQIPPAASSPRRQRDRDDNDRDQFKVDERLGILSGIILAVASILVLLAAGYLSNMTATTSADTATNAVFRPEVVLPLLVVAGVIAFLLALMACVAFLAVFGLTSWRYALGLPDGSIRAVIALGLVLIFAIVSIYLYGSTANVQRSTATNLPAEALPALAPGSVISIVPHPASPVPGSSGEPETVYDVTTRVSGTETSDDLARQLITLLGTLVAALTAFYFGTKTAETAGITAGATAAVRAMGAGPSRQVRILEPPGDSVVLPASDSTLPITVVTVPVDADVGHVIKGDKDGKVQRDEPTRFVYTRGTNPGTKVEITFWQTADPTVRADITVTKT